MYNLIKRSLVFFLVLLIGIQASYAFVYSQSYDKGYYSTLDSTYNGVFSYNYREANKNSDRYDKQFEVRDEDKYYNVYNTRQGFREVEGYTMPVTKTYNLSVSNRWRD